MTLRFASSGRIERPTARRPKCQASRPSSDGWCRGPSAQQSRHPRHVALARVSALPAGRSLAGGLMTIVCVSVLASLFQSRASAGEAATPRANLLSKPTLGIATFRIRRATRLWPRGGSRDFFETAPQETGVLSPRLPKSHTAGAISNLDSIHAFGLNKRAAAAT
jgi:hypothetical protein